MGVPAVTAPAGPVLTTCRSADRLTVVLTGLLSLVKSGSKVLLLTLAVLTMVGPAEALKWSTSRKTAWLAAPGAKEELPATTVPVLPAGGTLTEKAGPLTWAKDTEVVPDGVKSVREASWAALGPLLTTVIV